MFRKILIANRGEIAIRIIRACKELDIKTVAIHSTADADSLHVRLADEKVCIGPPEPKRSYLNIHAILSASEITGADAVHPGYGFMAENADFAEACENCGIKFIGPPSETIRLMGDKIESRRIALKAGVPVLPGSDSGLKDEKEAASIAKEIGFPVIIKASGGGGGKGMKIVHSPTGFSNAFHAAKAEATASFKNSEVYIEKYCERPRHIEVQIMADQYGNIIHLGERECSIQRRHQKLIEETPSPAVDDRLRKGLTESALKIARSVGYTNVGTVEFLLDRNNDFYFIEMNTRIQVEHPITEMVTGIDIIKEQIRLAYGERLKLKQRDIKFRGHSIECRITAEDPKRFIPSPGRIKGLHIPGGLGIRVDSALHDSCTVSPYYDPLIAKVIAYGDTRMEALSRMSRALEEFIIEGISTTIPLHLEILKDHDFLTGNIDVEYITRFL